MIFHVQGLICLQDGWWSSLRLSNEPWWTYGGKSCFLHQRHNGSPAVSSQLQSGSLRHKGKKKRECCCYSLPWYRELPAAQTGKRCSLYPKEMITKWRSTTFQTYWLQKGLADLQCKVFFFLQTRNALISLIHWFVLKDFLDLMKE